MDINRAKRYAPVVAYLLLALAVVLVFTRIEIDRSARAVILAQQTKSNKSQRIDLTNQLCIQSEISREALRQQITATAELAKSLVPAQNPALVQNVLNFQATQLARLPKIVCETNETK